MMGLVTWAFLSIFLYFLLLQLTCFIPMYVKTTIVGCCLIVFLFIASTLPNFFILPSTKNIVENEFKQIAYQPNNVELDFINSYLESNNKSSFNLKKDIKSLEDIFESLDVKYDLASCLRGRNSFIPFFDYEDAAEGINTCLKTNNIFFNNKFALELNQFKEKLNIDFADAILKIKNFNLDKDNLDLDRYDFIGKKDDGYFWCKRIINKSKDKQNDYCLNIQRENFKNANDLDSVFDYLQNK